MMAFVVLLVVSLATFVSVESKNSSQATRQLLARQNALLGILVATGELQKTAGVDERAMANAGAFDTSILGTSSEKWLGIIDATDPNSDLSRATWMVSTPQPNKPPLPTGNLNDGNSAIVVRGFKTSTGVEIPEVRAPLRAIDSDQQQVAYWVADESMKASIAARPQIDAQADDWLEESFGRSNAQRLDQIIPKRAGVEILFDPVNNDSETVLRQLSNISSTDQLPLASAWDLTDYDDYFHDITDRTFGVLASTTGTGLRTDLSLRPDLISIPGRFDTIYDFEAYMETPPESFLAETPYIPARDDPRRRYRITAPSTTTVGEIKDGVYPVITDFKILLHVHVSDSTVVNRTASSTSPIDEEGQIVVRSMVHVELWNPYTSALVPEDLVLEIKDLPIVTISFVGARGRTVDFAVDLNNVLDTSGSGDAAYYIELPFEDRGFSNHDDFSWLPGRVYNWVGPNNYSAGSPKDSRKAKFYNRSLNDGIWYEATGFAAPIPTRDFALSAPETSISVALRKKNANGDLDTGPLLSRVEDISYLSFDTGTSFSPDGKSPSFGYQIQRDESGFVALTENSEPFEKSRWLRVDDPRHPRPQFDDTGDAVSAFLPPNGLDPTGYTSTGVSNLQFLFDRVAGGTGLRPSEDIPLFELFRQRPVSIGELQHLSIIDERPFAIGNSWGSQDGKRFNRIFDEAFFSGLDPVDTTPDPTQKELFPNHRLRTAGEISGEKIPTLDTIINSGEDSSQFFLTEGAFNINSASASAWAVILGSIYFNEWEVANINEITGDIEESNRIVTKDIGQAILRFPQSAQEVFIVGKKNPNDEAFAPPTEFFRRGAKHFGTLSGDPDEGGPNDITPYIELGAAVAERVKERITALGPFTSLEEFLAPVELGTFSDPNVDGEFLSLIERAILDVNEINRSTSEGDIWHHTSSFLSQADVMTGIAPIANVRGDTFFIRAVGISNSSFSNSDKVTAVCEARVQRIPQTVDPTDDITQPRTNGFGRQFTITSLRWLEASEL